MQHSSTRLWQRLVIYVLLMSILNSYAGGYLYAQQFRQDRTRQEHNALALSRLGYDSPPTPELIQARKQQARDQIQRSRVAFHQKAAQGRKVLQEAATTIKAGQLPRNLEGLSQTIDQLVSRLRLWENEPTRKATREEALELYFLRENLRAFSQQLEKAGLLETRSVLRSRAVLASLEGLGGDAAGVDPAVVPGIASGTLDILRGMVREDEARHRISKGKGLPHPRFPGVDPLTGRTRQAPQPPRMKPLRTEPLPPLEGPALLETFRPEPGEGVKPPQINARLQEEGAAIAPPSSTDLTATTDIRFTPELQSLADSMSGDPVKLYNWVLQNVQYRLYAGSVYGSQGTLQGLTGNDVDQASLLIGLLRISDIPARYETGTVIIPVEQVPGLTGIQDPATAASALTTQGIPATVLYSSSKVVGIQLQRTWVRAYLPYSNYRGAQANTSGGGTAQWVALDPAFKRIELRQDVDLIGKATFDEQAFVSAPTTTSPRQFFEDALRAYIKSSGTQCETLESAEVRRLIGTKSAEILPVKLPYEVKGTPVSASALTSAQRLAITYEAMDAYGYTVFSRSYSAAELYGKRVSFTFPSGSGIYSAQSGTVKPTLAIDTTIAAQASGVSAGSDVPLYVSIKGPNQSRSYHDHTLTAGGSYVVNAWIGPVPAPLVASAEAVRFSLVESSAPKNQIDLATAYVAGLSYHQSLAEDDDHLYALQGYMHFTEMEALTGADMAPLYFWGMPYGAEPAGYQIDAENLFFAMPLRGTLDKAFAAKLAKVSGYNASYHEHALWEKVVRLQALSSTNILQLAKQEGQSVYFLKSTADYNAIKSTLQHPTAVINDVTQTLSAGDQVVISQRPVTRGDKTVSGYVLSDPDTGAGRYLINSTLNGGVTLEGILAALSEAASLLGFGVGISSMANVAEGSLSDDQMELTLFAYGRPHVITLSYHSEQKQPSELGQGWSWSFGERLYENTSTGAISRLTPEGVLVPYARNTDGTYAGPGGSTDVLSRTSDGWKITMRDGRVLSFDGSGRFKTWADRSGNVLTMNRNTAGHPTTFVTTSGTVLLTLTTNSEGQITEMRDALNRTLTLAYTAGKLTSVLDARGHTWRYSYANGPQLIGKVEGDNTGIEYGFDGDGRLARYTTPTGGEGYFAYDIYNRQSVWTTPVQADNLYSFDVDGRLLRRIDSVGNQTTYQYQNGRLSSVEDARGGKASYTYDSRGNTTGITAPDNTTTTLTYDSNNRVTQRTDESGTQTWVYNDTQHTTTRTSTDGSVEVVTLNTSGQVVSVNRDGETSSYDYDAKGNLVSIIEPGNTTTLTRDTVGRVTGIQGNDGTSLTVTYDNGDKPSGIQLPNGGRFDATFSPHGLLQSLKDPTGNTVHYAYSSTWLMSSTDAFGRVQRWQRDGAGRVLSQQDLMGNTTRYDLDPSGRLLSVQNPYGQVTEFGYCADISSSPCDEIDPFGNLTQRTFDVRGRLTKVTTPLGDTEFEYAFCPSCGGQGVVSAVTNVLGERTEYEYDSKGQLTKLIDALEQATEYTYDARGKVTSLKDATGHTTQYERDARGQLKRIMDALNRTTYLTYDDRGLLTDRVNANGESTSYDYDDMGNMTLEAFEDGTSRTYSFDSASRLTSAISEAADLRYTYADPFGRLTSVVNQTLNERIEYQYDPVTTMRSAIVRPDGTQTFSYDAFGHLISTTLPDGQRIQMRYDAYGRLSEKRYPNGNVQKDSYDLYGRLASRLIYSHAGTLVGGYTYTYDALGRRLSSTDFQGLKRTYLYDEVGRLIEEKKGADSTTYTYDEIGNRLSKSLNGVVNTLYTYDITHRLTSATENGVQTTFTYDDNGQLISSLTGGIKTDYIHDLAGQLIETRRNGVMLSRYDYDAQGRRISVENSDGKVFVLYDQEDAVVEVDASGNVVRGFAHGEGLDEPLAQMEYVTSAGTYFYHTDAVGSVVAVSSASGAVIQRFQYSAFGEQQAEGTLSTGHTYAGRPYDATTGQYDFRSRQLDPRLGRFTSPDPLTPAAMELPDNTLASTLTRSQTSVAGMLGQPQWMSPFAYAGNDPVNFVDTLGQFILCDYQPSEFMSWVIGVGMTGIGLFLGFLAGLVLAIVGLLLAVWQLGCQLKMVDDAQGLTDDQRSMIKGFAVLIFVLGAIIGIAGIWLGSVGVFVALTLLITFYTIIMGLFIELFINIAVWNNRRFEGL